MRPEFLFALLLSALFALPAPLHAQTGSDTLNDHQCTVDLTKVTFLPFEPFLVLDRDVKPLGHPALIDIARAECLLNDRLAQWNSDEADPERSQILDMERYHRQYCSLIDSNGHHLLYLDAFCGDQHLDSWMHRWVVVQDGGSCYFQALFDLTSQRIVMFSVNGMG